MTAIPSMDWRRRNRLPRAVARSPNAVVLSDPPRCCYPLDALSVDHHTVAAIALTGTSLNLLGGLYLAYDLFGGKHGPLRTLTRAVTYGVLFFLSYIVLLPVRFSALAALGTGSTLAI